MPDILNADDLERVDVPPSERTEARDDAAEYIEEMWPTTLTEIAEESGYSRQHVKNTLSRYFKPAEEEGNNMEITAGDAPDLNLPGHERELLQAYRLGYRDGFEDGRDAG